MYDDCNFKEDMSPNPSYFRMHSLKDGLYSGTHRSELRPDICIHKYNTVMILLPEWMVIIWHASLFHAGENLGKDYKICDCFLTYGHMFLVI